MRVLRRWPPLVWLLVYVASLLVLMGIRRPDVGAVGLALLLAAFVLAVYLAVRREPGRPRPRGFTPTMAGLVLFYVIAAVVAAVALGPEYGAAAFLGGVIPMTAAALVLASARRRTSGSSEGGTLRDDSVEDQGPVPSIGMDDETPLGDSPEVHGTISPRDLPVGHPGRQEAERQAGGWGGRTRGDRQGGATGTRRPLSPEHEDVLEGGEHAAAREGRWPSAD